VLSKVMLVDDHPLFLEGLQYLLETHGVNVIGAAQSGREALLLARSLKPEIILMDIKMPDLNGIETLKLIKAEMPDIKVIMLTTSEEDEDLLAAVKYGASGYLLKNTTAEALIHTLSDLEKGEVPYSDGLAAKLLREFQISAAEDGGSWRASAADAGEGLLTSRQKEILKMVAQGITYKEAGERLGLTERTVKYHMGRIIEILQLENRAQVIAYAARIGLVDNNKQMNDPDAS
jgi:DNA-binding NarL/FixJ family response regulator